MSQVSELRQRSTIDKDRSEVINTNAWLLTVSNTQDIAVAEYQMNEYVSLTTAMEIPLAPSYCNKMVFWQERRVPLMALGILLGDDRQTQYKGYVVVACQSAPRAPLQYVGLLVLEPPTRIAVNSQAEISIPGSVNDILQQVFISCFLHENKTVPVLDSAYLFSKKFRLLTLK